MVGDRRMAEKRGLKGCRLTGAARQVSCFQGRNLKWSLNLAGLHVLVVFVRIGGPAFAVEMGPTQKAIRRLCWVGSIIGGSCPRESLSHADGASKPQYEKISLRRWNDAVRC